MEKSQKYINAEDMVLARQGKVFELGGSLTKKRKEAAPSRTLVAKKDKKTE